MSEHAVGEKAPLDALFDILPILRMQRRHDGDAAPLGVAHAEGGDGEGGMDMYDIEVHLPQRPTEGAVKARGRGDVVEEERLEGLAPHHPIRVVVAEVFVDGGAKDGDVRVLLQPSCVAVDDHHDAVDHGEIGINDQRDP